MIKQSPGGEISDAGNFQVQAASRSLKFLAQNYKKAYNGNHGRPFFIMYYPSKPQRLYETASEICAKTSNYSYSDLDTLSFSLGDLSGSQTRPLDNLEVA